MYLNENKLLSNCQSGFRPLNLTIATSLTEITDYLFDKMDQENVIGGIFLDLRSLKPSLLFHTIMFVDNVCIMELKETSIIGWNLVATSESMKTRSGVHRDLF